MDRVGVAVRQFERGVLIHQDSREPPDDRKTFDDIFRYPGIQRHIPLEECTLIATITYRLDIEEIIVKREYGKKT